MERRSSLWTCWWCSRTETKCASSGTAAARWEAFTYDRPVRATRAHVDPGRVLLLDVNYTNNSKTSAPKTAEATTKWMLKWVVWLQDFMLTYAFFV